MSRTRLLSSPRSFLFSAGSTRPASGIRLGFNPVSGNESSWDYPGEANFFMDITDISDRRIMLTFHNRASVHCIISSIYVEDGETFSIAVQSIRDTGAAMSQACAIDTGTGGLRFAPDSSQGTSTCRTASRNLQGPAAMQDGIKPNESLGVVFELQAGVTLADIISALSRGTLNISLKLSGVAQGAGGILINDTRLGLSPG